MKVVAACFVLVLWGTLLLGCDASDSGPLAITAANTSHGELSTRVSSVATVVFPTISSASPTSIPTVPVATPNLPTAVSPLPTAIASSDDALAARLVGLWHNSSSSFHDLRSAGSFYYFHADGTWGWDIERRAVLSGPENYGEWYVQENVLYLRDTGGLEPCDADQVGTYHVSFEEQDLVLTLLQDLCSARVGQTRGRFSLLKR